MLQNNYLDSVWNSILESTQRAGDNSPWDPDKKGEAFLAYMYHASVKEGYDQILLDTSIDLKKEHHASFLDGMKKAEINTILVPSNPERSLRFINSLIDAGMKLTRKKTVPVPKFLCIESSSFVDAPNGGKVLSCFEFALDNQPQYDMIVLMKELMNGMYKDYFDSYYLVPSDKVTLLEFTYAYEYNKVRISKADPLRLVAARFLETEEGKKALEDTCDDFNWGDFDKYVPDAFFAEFGIIPVTQGKASGKIINEIYTVVVNHDELLSVGRRHAICEGKEKG